MYLITVEDHFDAAHHLVGYDGPCARVHGHRWVVRACWQGKLVNEQGMLVDFKEVKGSLHEVASRYDHQDVNDFITEYPTAENIAYNFFYVLKNRVMFVELMWVEVEESPGCVIRYKEDES